MPGVPAHVGRLGEDTVRRWCLQAKITQALGTVNCHNLILDFWLPSL